MPFIGPLDYASHLRFTLRPWTHRYSSILIHISVYHFPVRIASMTGYFFTKDEMGLEGMISVAHPHRPGPPVRRCGIWSLILATTK